MNTLNKSKRILIIQTAFLGDVILTTPLIEVIHQHFSEYEIDFLTIPDAANIFQSNPNLKNTIIFDKKGKDKGFKAFYSLARNLADQNYEICITPHRSLRSAYLTKSTKAAYRIGFDSSAWPGAFTHVINYQHKIHEIERNLSLLQPLGIKKHQSLYYPKIFPTREDIKVVLEILQSLGMIDGQNLFAIAPGSIWATKRWPLIYFQKFCHLLSQKNMHIILLGSVDDAILCNIVEQTCDNCKSLAGKLTLRQTKYLLERCQGILTNDSAPLHLGMAANIPVFAIFGPTIPKFGFAPFGTHSKVFEREDLACRPCDIHGGKKCPTRTFACMEEIYPEIVFRKVMDEILRDTF
jgi:heptosyltransferase-2